MIDTLSVAKANSANNKQDIKIKCLLFTIPPTFANYLICV